MNGDNNNQYGYNPQQNYGMPSGYNQPPQKNTNGMAIASFVLSIVGFVMCCCTGISIICSVLAVIFAFISKSKSPGRKMSGLAIAGLIIGILGLVVSVICILIVLLDYGNVSFYIDDFMREYGYGNSYNNFQFSDFGDF